jgi:hypothetical protein
MKIICFVCPISKVSPFYIEDGKKEQVNDGEENWPKQVGVDLHQGIHESCVDHPGDDKLCKWVVHSLDQHFNYH